jgi:uncharacterized membrane protein YraQ (UPF0718 family)
LFFTGDPVLSAVWGPLVGPVVAILSFVCSIGNVPLAAVLWNGGISFGGVIAFLFADLLILPILNIYRKYYGVRMALVLLGTFYAAMVAAGYLVDLAAGISWNYTTWLDIAFLVLGAILVVRFVRTGGVPMLRMMNGAPAEQTSERTRRIDRTAYGYRSRSNPAAPERLMAEGRSPHVR